MFALELWRERADDFSEARITAERVPLRVQFQSSVENALRNLRGGRQLFEGQIFFASPGTYDREISYKLGSDRSILG